PFRSHAGHARGAAADGVGRTGGETGRDHFGDRPRQFSVSLFAFVADSAAYSGDTAVSLGRPGPRAYPESAAGCAGQAAARPDADSPEGRRPGRPCTAAPLPGLSR